MRRVTYTLALFSATLAAAQFSTPAPGEYIGNEFSFGTLSVKADHTFKIDSSSYARTCAIEGRITNGISTISDSTCKITFKAEGDGFIVTVNPEGNCQDFCGMNASFDGLYRKPGPLCTKSAMSRSRTIFKKDYQAKNFKAAFEALNPIATQCLPFMDPIEAAPWVLNDLALTQFRLGDAAACVKTLQTLMKSSKMSDSEIREESPKTIVDSELSIARATRTNLKLCTHR